MRTILFSVAAAVSALGFAAPAAAQYWPQPQVYGYNQAYVYPGYSQGYGYQGYSQGYGYPGYSQGYGYPGYGQGYGYPGYSQGYGYQGYNQGYGSYGRVRSLDARIDQLRQQIRQLSWQGRLNRRDAAILDRQALVMKRNLRYVASDRFTARESYQFERGIERLRYTIQREVRAGPGYRYSRYGY